MKVGDPVTVFYWIENKTAWGNIEHVGNSYIRVRMLYGIGDGRVIRTFGEEHERFIRGHHAPDSAPVLAMRAAAALMR